MTFEDRAAFYRSRAAVALAHQHWGEAVEQLQTLVAIPPNDATAWNLGVALEHKHKNKEAVEAYGRAAAERYFYKGGAAGCRHRPKPLFRSPCRRRGRSEGL
jgi:hypothetical protein